MKPLLHPITPADITHIHRGLSHPEVIRYYAVRYDARGHQSSWNGAVPLKA